MKKTVIGKEVYFTLAWSPLYPYDRFEAMRKMPELGGIICLLYQNQSRVEYLIFYSCHRDGCRVGFKKFMDPFARFHKPLQPRRRMRQDRQTPMSTHNLDGLIRPLRNRFHTGHVLEG